MQHTGCFAMAKEQSVTVTAEHVRIAATEIFQSKND